MQNNNQDRKQEIIFCKKKISENEILNLLELQIHLHAGDAKYANAIEKWKRDFDFVKSYEIESGKIRTITSIKM